MDQIIAALLGPEFIRGAILLVLTTVLAGFVVPQIVAILSDRRQRSQKIFEAELSRQRYILEAQSALLVSFSKQAWRWQLLNINVSFCKLQSTPENYKRARDQYQRESAEILGGLRADISSSKRLVSPTMQERLQKLYFETVLPLDTSLEYMVLNESEMTVDQWKSQHNLSFVRSQNVLDEVLTQLAVELKLASATSLAK